MKFLPDGHKSGKIVRDNHTIYYVWDAVGETTSIEDGIFSGYGIEVMVVHPTTRYLYDYEFPSHDKFLKSPPFIHMHGVCRGSLIENDQLPLFHVYQTFPYWKKMFSNGGFDHYIMTLVGVSLLEFRINKNMTICLDESQSRTVQHLSRLYSLSGLAPDPINVKLNSEDYQFDFDKFGIKFKLEEIEFIDDVLLHRGENLSRYEINNAVNGRKDLPRFLRQSELKRLDLSAIVCDNQLSLF